MKPLIILAALLLPLTLACVAPDPGLDIPVQRESRNDKAEPITAARESLATAEKPTPEPTAEPAAVVDPLTIRDAYRGGMDSLLRELHYPMGGRVLVALPQTAEEDLHCNPTDGGGGTCSLVYPDLEGELSTWFASFNFAELEAVIAFRESIGRGPVTVSCILSEFAYASQGAGFTSCEERKDLTFPQERAGAALATVEAGWKALTPEPTPTLRPRIIQVEVPVQHGETWGSNSWPGGSSTSSIVKLGWSPSPEESLVVHLAEEEQRDFRCHSSASSCRIDHPGGWMVCRGREETYDRGVLRVDYADCVRDPNPPPTATPEPTATPVYTLDPNRPIRVEVPGGHGSTWSGEYQLEIGWEVGEPPDRVAYTVVWAYHARIKSAAQGYMPGKFGILGGWVSCAEMTPTPSGGVKYVGCVRDAE